MSDKIYLADKLTLDSIKADTNFLVKQIKGLSSFAEMQDAIRAGEIGYYMKVGDQFLSSYNGGTIVWEVIGIDVDTPADSRYTHSMTIQTKDCLSDIQFDAAEPSNPDANRANYGNNRYIHSAVRQWLNSDESAFNWESQHQYDAKPTSNLDLYNGAGFLHRLDPELVAVIGPVKKQVARNTVTDGSGKEYFEDKVFLLSQYEVDLGTSDAGDVAGEFTYPFYQGKNNANRIKQLGGTNRVWWLRSPHVSNSNHVRYVNSDGSVANVLANYAFGLSPACCII